MPNSNIISEIDGFYDRVRSILGIQNDILSDATISLYEYSGLAKILIDKKVGDTSGYTSEQVDILNCCYVYETALMCLPLIIGEKDVKLEQTTHAKTEYFKNSINDLAITISERLSTFLALLGVGGTSASRTIFEISNESDRYEGETYHI